MARRGVWRGLKVALIVVAAAAALGAIVMTLWNALMPALFNAHVLSFWQALGLLVLCRVLFGRFGRPGGPGGRWRRHMMERWAQMTPQEREQARAHWRGGCGWGEAHAPEDHGPAGQA